jgi:GT2 family glycosyltransferase
VSTVAELPSFSIILPTFARPRQLERCLRGLAALDYPTELVEVIVIDDGGNPPLDRTCPDATLDGRIRWLRQENGGPAAARNAGAAVARGTYLAFIDDDCIAQPQWLRRIAAAMARQPEALVGGRTINALARNPYAEASQQIVDIAYASLFAAESELRFFATNNFALLAERFRAQGGFDPTFRTSEDRDFCDRWLRAGHALVYAEEAVVEHHSELDLARYCRQHFAYGMGAYRFHRARTARGSRSFRPDLSYYRDVFSYPFTPPARGNRLALCSLFALWQVVNLAGYLWQGYHLRPRNGASPSRSPQSR